MDNQDKKPVSDDILEEVTGGQMVPKPYEDPCAYAALHGKDDEFNPFSYPERQR